MNLIGQPVQTLSAIILISIVHQKNKHKDYPIRFKLTLPIRSRIVIKPIQNYLEYKYFDITQ